MRLLKRSYNEVVKKVNAIPPFIDTSELVKKQIMIR